MYHLVKHNRLLNRLLARNVSLKQSMMKKLFQGKKTWNQRVSITQLRLVKQNREKFLLQGVLQYVRKLMKDPVML